jgi:hypothetical protein
MQSKQELAYSCMVYKIAEAIVIVPIGFIIIYLHNNYKIKHAWTMNVFLFSMIFIIILIFKYYTPQCSRKERILRYMNDT